MTEQRAYSGLPFRKMHGLGNDFVVIDGRGGGPSVTPALARALGDRHRGVGFDQIAEIRDPGASDEAARVIFWNPDGGVAGACGNATRCVADLLMRGTGARTIRLRTARGVLACARRADGLISVNMGAPELDWRDIPLAGPEDTARLSIDGAPGAVGMGNPHCVFFVDESGAAPVETLGPAIERHALFPEGTNVEFVQILARDRLRMRVWERGAGVTLACGSGACAAVAAAARRGLCERRAVVELDGGALDIDWRGDGVHMAGPVAYVFEGALSADFVARALGENAA